jgi:hypothetical protein
MEQVFCFFHRKLQLSSNHDSNGQRSESDLVKGVLHRPRHVPHRRHLLRPRHGLHATALGLKFECPKTATL